MVTPPVIRGKRSQLLHMAPELVHMKVQIQTLTSAILTHRFQHCVLNQCLFFLFFPPYHSISLSSCFPFSVADDKPECYASAERFRQSDVDQDVSRPVAVHREARADAPPTKTFLKAGLYSDDYKTTE